MGGGEGGKNLTSGKIWHAHQRKRVSGKDTMLNTEKTPQRKKIQSFHMLSFKINNAM